MAKAGEMERRGKEDNVPISLAGTEVRKSVLAIMRY